MWQYQRLSPLSTTIMILDWKKYSHFFFSLIWKRKKTPFNLMFPCQCCTIYFKCSAADALRMRIRTEPTCGTGTRLNIGRNTENEQYCQNPTLTQLNFSHLSLMLDIVATCCTHHSIHPKLWKVTSRHTKKLKFCTDTQYSHLIKVT